MAKKRLLRWFALSLCCIAATSVSRDADAGRWHRRNRCCVPVACCPAPAPNCSATTPPITDPSQLPELKPIDVLSDIPESKSVDDIMKAQEEKLKQALSRDGKDTTQEPAVTN